MQNIFIFPARDENSQINYQKTVVDGIELSTLETLIPPATFRFLENSYRDGICYVWGSRIGGTNKGTWERMHPGDLVLGYWDKTIRCVANAVLTKHDSALAKKIWGDADDPFELIYFITRPEFCEISIQRLPLGKKYQRLTRLGDDTIRAIRSKYGTIENFVESGLLKNNRTKEPPKIETSTQLTRNPPWYRDELILALDLYFKVDPVHTTENNSEIIELSNLLNSLPIHSKSSQQQAFRNPNGVYMKLCNFLRFDPDYKGTGPQRGAKLEKEIWQEFANDREKLRAVATAIKANYTTLSPISLEQELEEDEEAPEGQVLNRTHKLRERNPALIKKKKAQVLNSKGKLACEVCNFDFHVHYGDIGKGFAECHHTKPVSQLQPGETTKLSELSIVCANCHRMLHKSRPWPTIEGLRIKMSNQTDHSNMVHVNKVING